MPSRSPTAPYACIANCRRMRARVSTCTRARHRDRKRVQLLELELDRNSSGSGRISHAAHAHICMRAVTILLLANPEDVYTNGNAYDIDSIDRRSVAAGATDGLQAVRGAGRVAPTARIQNSNIARTRIRAIGPPRVYSACRLLYARVSGGKVPMNETAASILTAPVPPASSLPLRRA